MTGKTKLRQKFRKESIKQVNDRLGHLKTRQLEWR